MGCASSKVTPTASPASDKNGQLYGEQPPHWSAVSSKEYQTNGFRAVKLAKDDGIWQQLERFLEVDDASALGYGRDMQQKSKQKYTKLHLAAAWRIQNPALWSRYVAGKAKIRRDVHSLQKLCKGLPRRGAPGLPLRLHDRAKALPGGALDDEVKESMLMHGTKPNFLLDILANGPNERYSGAIGTLFGNGMYFAEDADKVDQYVACDKAFVKQRGPFKGALHARLYGSAREQSHPGHVYYLLVCRIALGHYVRTRDAAPKCTSLDGPGGGGAPCFAGDNPRELAAVPGVNPPIHYHALLGEKGPGHLRHREVVLFHGEYLYPEYLLGVQRLSPKGMPI